MFDLLIQGGTIVDGSGEPRFAGDVAVRDDRIAAVGRLDGAAAQQTIDATGMIVAPGFVDVHNHSDGWMLKTPHQTAKTLQGFSTEILMADGISYAPVNSHTAREWLFYLRALDGLRLDEYTGWESLADYMHRIHGRNVQNAATHIPYANVRSLACGFGRQTVDDFQMRTIEQEIRRGMSEGAVGLSTGLDYIVQCFSPTDELVEACRVVAEFDGLYVTHVRYKKGLLPALEEAVEIGKRSGVRVHISHLKGQSPGQVEQVLHYIDTVARNEIDISFDVYPYQPGSTMLSYLMPYEAWVDGPLAALSRLQRPEVQTQFRDGLKAYRLDLDHIRIAWVASKENSQHQGRLLSEYVDQMGLPAEEALLNLLIEERLAVLLVFDEGDDALVEPFLSHDLYMMGTDGIHTADGPVHPRQFGSVGRFLGHCVRETKLLSLEQAVCALSRRPAERFGLENRGIVKEGHFADIVTFDAETITDRATFLDPRRETTGVDTLLVNGTTVVRHGLPDESLADRHPGRFLKFRAEK